MASCRYVLVNFILCTMVFEIGQAIRCFDCSSINNTMCLDPTLYDAATIEKYLRSVDCEAGVSSATHQSFFCRKIVQTILHKGHDSEVRVSRNCGWIKHHKECYKADNEDHLETVCQCFHDDCNDATSLKKITLLGSIVSTACILGLSSNLY